MKRRDVFKGLAGILACAAVPSVAKAANNNPMSRVGKWHVWSIWGGKDAYVHEQVADDLARQLREMMSIENQEHFAVSVEVRFADNGERIIHVERRRS